MQTLRPMLQLLCRNSLKSLLSASMSHMLRVFCEPVSVIIQSSAVENDYMLHVLHVIRPAFTIVYIRAQAAWLITAVR